MASIAGNSVLFVLCSTKEQFNKAKNIKDNTLYFIKYTQEIYLGKLRMGIGKLSDEDSVYIDKYKIMMGEGLCKKLNFQIKKENY